MRLWRSVLAVIALPTLVAIIIPALILGSARPLHVGWGLPGLWRLLPIGGGALLVWLGLRLIGETVRRFHQEGEGTLAPWDPPRELVVSGVYRRVRNPMISGVFCVLLGESALAGSPPLLLWALGVGLLNAVYIPFVEEPDLAERFGERYQIYRQSVPRWVPRRQPWQPPWDDRG